MRPTPALNRLCTPSALLLPRFAGEGNPGWEGDWEENYELCIMNYALSPAAAVTYTATTRAAAAEAAATTAAACAATAV